MRVIKCFIGLFLLVSGVKAQKTSTVFIDSVSVKINDKIIYDQNRTYLKFLPSNKTSALTLFDDGTYKLQLEFPAYLLGDYFYLRPPDVKFFKNDVLQALATEELDAGSSEWTCSGVHDERYKITPINNGLDKSNTEILLRFRYFGFAPKDTTNYQYNYRQGEWIGFYDGIKEITINYQLDIKDGKATVVYNDGTIYKSNFVNGIVDDFGYGIFESRKKAKYLIPNIVSRSCDDKLSSLYMEKGKKYKEISRYDRLSVFFETRGIKTDSVAYNVQGDMVTIMDDTMIIHSEELEVHDYYKRNTDPFHFYYKNIPRRFQKIPLKDITLIKKTRPVLQTSVISLTLLSLVSAIVVSPLVSIQKDGFNANRFRKVSGVSLGIATISVSTGVLFGSKKFLVKPTSRERNVWKMSPDYE